MGRWQAREQSKAAEGAARSRQRAWPFYPRRAGHIRSHSRAARPCSISRRVGIQMVERAISTLGFLFPVDTARAAHPISRVAAAGQVGGSVWEELTEGQQNAAGKLGYDPANWVAFKVMSSRASLPPHACLPAKGGGGHGRPFMGNVRGECVGHFDGGIYGGLGGEGGPLAVIPMELLRVVVISGTQQEEWLTYPPPTPPSHRAERPLPLPQQSGVDAADQAPQDTAVALGAFRAMLAESCPSTVRSFARRSATLVGSNLRFSPAFPRPFRWTFIHRPPPSPRRWSGRPARTGANSPAPRRRPPPRSVPPLPRPPATVNTAVHCPLTDPDGT